MKKVIKLSLRICLSFGILYAILLIYPNPLFAHNYEYKNFNIYSDQQIPVEIENVIDDALNRLVKSELYHQNEEFNVYICNASWRFQLFTRNQKAGGAVNFAFCPHIFLRESNIEENKLIPHKSWKYKANSESRSLAYFLTHEAVHSLQCRYDRMMVFYSSTEIIEGYADYIAKSDEMLFDKLKKAYLDDSPKMDPKNGLYDIYTLYMSYLIDQMGYNYIQILDEEPNMDEVLQSIVK